MIGCLLLLPNVHYLGGPELALGWIYYTTVGAVAILLCYEHSVVNANDLTKVNIAFFNVNSIISVGLFLIVSLDFADIISPLIRAPLCYRCSEHLENFRGDLSMFLKSVPIQAGCLLLLMSLVTGCVGEKSPVPVDPSESGGQLETATDPIGEQTAIETVEATEVAPQTEIVLDNELGQLLSELGDGTTEERIAASTALSERVNEVIEQHADWMVAGSDSQRRGIMLIMTGKAQQYPEQSFGLVQHALQDSDHKVRSIGIQLIRQLIPGQAVQLHASLITMMKSSEETTENRVSVLRLINLVPGDALATEAALGGNYPGGW